MPIGQSLRNLTQNPRLWAAGAASAARPAISSYATHMGGGAILGGLSGGLSGEGSTMENIATGALGGAITRGRFGTSKSMAGVRAASYVGGALGNVMGIGFLGGSIAGGTLGAGSRIYNRALGMMQQRNKGLAKRDRLGAGAMRYRALGMAAMGSARNIGRTLTKPLMSLEGLGRGVSTAKTAARGIPSALTGAYNPGALSGIRAVNPMGTYKNPYKMGISYADIARGRGGGWAQPASSRPRVRGLLPPGNPQRIAEQRMRGALGGGYYPPGARAIPSRAQF